jgi:hypothetical protein
MADLQDLWVKTTKGLVRADQIVHVRIHGSQLQVMLSLIETDPTATITDVNQITHTIGKVHANDAGADFALVDFISKCRGEGKRGVIEWESESFLLKFHEFDELDQD